MVYRMNFYQNTIGAWSRGNFIRLAGYSFSTFLFFAIPLLTIPVLNKVYRMIENIGPFLGGLWFGIEESDLIGRLFYIGGIG